MDTTTMTLEEKIRILAESARYDVSCSSSGSSRSNTKGGIGNAASSGICHSWSADGRCVSLLKILLTNICNYDCAYCLNRRSNDIRRVALTPEEVAELTINFYRRNYIEGLFLSTGVVRNPDYTMELLIRTVRTLREEHRFNGYIHLKLVPGADPLLVEQAGRMVDRVSINLELPTRGSLALLAPDKSREAILLPMRQVSGLITARRDQGRNAPPFVPAGQSTQVIIGATPDSDFRIMTISEQLYQRMGLKRVYYSAYVPVAGDPRLPALIATPLLAREHRLYQADWLLRFYGFRADELLDAGSPDLDQELDPKTGWALRHRQLFPVEVNRAEYEVLLRVPGIGVRSAKRIVRARRVQRLRREELAKLGVVMKRARYFLTADGAGSEGTDLSPERLKELLLPGKKRRSDSGQLSLFPPDPRDLSGITGEL